MYTDRPGGGEGDIPWASTVPPHQTSQANREYTINVHSPLELTDALPRIIIMIINVNIILQDMLFHQILHRLQVSITFARKIIY